MQTKIIRMVNPGRKRRVANPGFSIVTLNPGVKRKKVRKMAKKRVRRVRRTNSGVRRYARTRKTAVKRHRRRSNGLFSFTRKRYSRRRRNTGYSRKRFAHRRRRNTGTTSLFGSMSNLLPMLAGITLNKIIGGYLPAQLQTGIAGLFAKSVTAYGIGKIAKMAGQASLGNNLTQGALLGVGLEAIGLFLPNLALPLSLNGLGAYATGNVFNYPLIPNPPGAAASYSNWLPEPAPMPATAVGRLTAARNGRR